VDEAVDYIKTNRGTHFSPHLVDCFMEKLPQIMEVRNSLVDE
jgi:response regulator RpfG family c-di-GMP phosphodiesterase